MRAEMKSSQGSGFVLPAMCDIVHCWAKDVRGPALDLASWHMQYAEMKRISGASRPLIVTYNHCPCPVGPAPLLVTQVVLLPLTPMQVPPGLYKVENWRSLSDVVRWPCAKNRRCMILAWWSRVLSHCRFGSVNAKEMC